LPIFPAFLILSNTPGFPDGFDGVVLDGAGTLFFSTSGKSCVFGIVVLGEFLPKILPISRPPDRPIFYTTPRTLPTIPTSGPSAFIEIPAKLPRADLKNPANPPFRKSNSLPKILSFSFFSSFCI
jgi:hypothetical protein